MQNNENPNIVAIKLLNQVIANEPGRFEEMKNFFTESFLIHTNHDLMDEKSHRQKWVEYISVLDDFASVFKPLSQIEVDMALDHAVNVL